jgi:hypothetical protein
MALLGRYNLARVAPLILLVLGKLLLSVARSDAVFDRTRGISD